MTRGGNFFLLLILFFIAFDIQALHINLYPADLNGNPIKEISAGQSFEWVVIINDISLDDQLITPELTNTKRFIREKFQKTWTFKGGQIGQARYITQSYTDHPGLYQNIKAIVNYKGASYSSKPVSLEVKPTDKNFVHKEVKDQNIIIKLSTDKTRAVVGEKIIATLKIWVKPELHFEIRSDFFNNNTVIKNTKQFGIKKTDAIQGQAYNFYEWQWAMYPQQPGHHDLPPISVDLAIPVRKNSFGGLFQFTDIEQKRVSSNRISLDVDPLPINVPSTSLVGTNLEAVLQIKPAVCKEKEGITCTLEMTFNGNLEDFNYQMITDLPETVQCFFSKDTLHDSQSPIDFSKKTFEFILQPKEEGIFEIPEQTFWYYDTVHHIKKSVKSNSIVLTVLPKNHIEQQNDFAEFKEEKNEELIASLHTSNKWRMYYLPWWLFFIIIGMVFPLFAQQYARDYYTYYQNKPLKIALAAVHNACVVNNVGDLYAIFIQFMVSKKIIIASGSCMHENIEQVINQLPISAQQKKDYISFLQQLMKYAFDNSSLQDIDKQIFNQAKTWIALLDRHL